MVFESEIGEANFHKLLRVTTVTCSSIFIKHSLLKKYGGFMESPKVGKCEDYEFLLRYALKTKFYFIDEFLLDFGWG